MGMFSGLFGDSSTSSDSAQARQAALDAFNSIQTPALKDLQIQLDKYVQAGRLTPQEAEVQLLGSNAFNDIVTDPSYVGAQKQALQQMQNIATQGGLTAIDKAQLNDITNELNQRNRSQNEATMQQARQRGVGGSDLNTVNQLINEQTSADRAANQGLGVAAQAQARALAAMQAAGKQGGELEASDYAAQAEKARTQNAIEQFNKQTLNQANLYNTQTANQAQAGNLANAQAIENANTGTSNLNKQYNSGAVQQQYQNAMQKAGAIASVEQNAANAAQQQKNMEIGSNAGALSGLLGTAGTVIGGIYGGPVGAAVGSEIGTEIGGGRTTNKKITDESQLPGYDEGGEVSTSSDTAKDPEAVKKEVKDDKDLLSQIANILSRNADTSLEIDKNKGGMVYDFKKGGSVPGHAKVAGDSPKNDTVDAKLSPGEIVVPRSAASDDAEFEAFMEKFRPSRRPKTPPHGPLEVHALVNLHKRVKNMEKGGQC